MKNILTFIVISLSLIACATPNWYKGMQSRAQLKCLSVPESEYEDCMKVTKESYDEYKEKRQDLQK